MKQKNLETIHIKTNKIEINKIKTNKVETNNIEVNKKFRITYDTSKWREKITEPVPTLQLFITNRCNKRCKGCFYEESLGSEDMSLDRYRSLVKEYQSKIKKIILLGGEPSIHPDIGDMVRFNTENHIKTTIYTNGKDLKKLESVASDNAEELLDVRIGILGLYHGEKNLSEIKKTKIPVTIVYMLRQDNIDELMVTARYAQENFDCKKFYISSIRDIVATKDYWIDTKDTLSMQDYGVIVQKFIDEYDGNIPRIDISRRGTLTTINDHKYPKIDSCRFMNIFPDEKKIICPFDISKKMYTQETELTEFYSRRCNKNDQCLLQKIVLERLEKLEKIEPTS